MAKPSSSSRPKKWMQKAVKRPGAFTAWCKRHGYGSATHACIAHARKVAKKTGNTRLGRQAVLARTFKKHGGR